MTERAAIYARTATRDPHTPSALAGQVAACQDYVASQGWSLTATFLDHGVSGLATHRPGLDALIAAVGDIDVVVVASIDRLGRSFQQVSTLIDEVTERGVRLVSVREQFDLTATSGARFGLPKQTSASERPVNSTRRR